MTDDRIAPLLEMFTGASIMRQWIAEVWATAPEESRGAFARAVLKELQFDVSMMRSEIANAVQNYVRDRVIQHIGAVGAEIVDKAIADTPLNQMLTTAVDKELARAVNDRVGEAVEKAITAAKYEMCLRW